MAESDSRQRLLDVARRSLAVGERLSVAELSARAGVARSSFYRLFGSRAALLKALEVDADPKARERLLDAALELVGRDGLVRLSMEELATAAGVSRASLYRLFPGKPALFRELVHTFSPMEAIVATVDPLAGEPPARVMPEIARTVARTMGGRAGIVRTLLLEATSMAPESAEGFDYALTRGIGVVLAYITRQMAAGTLRRTEPLLALQSFVGPIVLHLLTQELAERRLAVSVPLEEAVVQLAEHWLRAMQPDK